MGNFSTKFGYYDGPRLDGDIEYPDPPAPRTSYELDGNGGWKLIPLTMSQYQSEAQVAAQNLLDSTAKSWGYDSLISAASYYNSSNPQFAAESKTLVNWRDALWTAAYAIDAGIVANAQPLPDSMDAFLALLPPVPVRPTV
jgi:hypothetical protein